MSEYTIRNTTEGEQEEWAFTGTAEGAMKRLRRMLRAADYESDGEGDVITTGDVVDEEGNVVCEVTVAFTDADDGEPMVVSDTTVTWVQP